MKKLNLNAETICDFYVDEKRKKIWQVELDIVEKIIDICEKNNINYSLSGGTLLGTIRHGGFIPWDDDIDIVMVRKDYENFLKIAKDVLKEPYFVQDFRTEKGYYYGHAQIRNSNTTAIIKDDDNRKFNHGIFVDIFTLDNLPDNLSERKKFLKSVGKSKKRIERMANPKGSNWIKSILKKLYLKIFLSGLDLNTEIEKFNLMVQKYNNIETAQSAAIAFKPDIFLYEKKWMEEFEERKFEYLNAKISKYYDEMLTRQYGDYMQIPENKGGSLHGSVFFDTENSYLKYENEIKDICKKL
jgi:lipopolysaccharide cholinephosphotransferase